MSAAEPLQAGEERGREFEPGAPPQHSVGAGGEDLHGR